MSTIQINSPYANLPNSIYGDGDVAALNSVNLAQLFAGANPYMINKQQSSNRGVGTNVGLVTRGLGGEQAQAAVTPIADKYNLDSANAKYSLDKNVGAEQGALGTMSNILGAAKTNADVSPYIQYLYNLSGLRNQILPGMNLASMF